MSAVPLQSEKSLVPQGHAHGVQIGAGTRTTSRQRDIKSSFFNCVDLHHKSPDSGKRQYKFRIGSIAVCGLMVPSSQLKAFLRFVPQVAELRRAPVQIKNLKKRCGRCLWAGGSK